MASSQPTTKSADTSAVRTDPVGDRYFRPLVIADKTTDWLFCLAAALSFAVILIDKETTPKWYNLANIAFIIAVVAVFVIGIICRLYLSPRAEDGRRRDLFTNSFNIDLTHETTTGYYNNDETNSFRRLALSVMESSFFTSRICLEMLYRTRIATASYLAVWSFIVLSRETDLGLIAAAAQALFSEILLSKWLRLEWLRRRSEEVYTHLSQLLKTARSFNKELTRAQAIEFVSYYETSKSNAGVVLSDAIFEKLNPSLSAEWERILKTLPKSTGAPSVRAL